MRKALASGIVLVLMMAVLTAISVAQDRIVIGINMELTGYSNDPGNEQYRGILAAHRLQHSVSANGKTYEIVFEVCDNQSQREESANCATRLAGRGVVGVLGGFSSSMSIAAGPISQDVGIVQISTGSTNPETTKIGDFIFRIPFTDDYQGVAVASYAYDTLGARRVVIFRQSDDDASVGITRVIVETLERLGAAVQVQSFNQATVDFSAQLNNARRFNPDVLITTAFCGMSGPLVRQSRALGFDQQWIGSDAIDAPSCVELGGTAFEGVMFTGFPDLSQLDPDALDRAQAVREAYFEMFPSSVGFGGVTLAGSDAYGVLRLSIERALASGASPADVSAFRRAVRDQLASLEGYPGVTGTLTFAGTNGTPAERSIGLLRVDGVQDDGRYLRVSQGYFIIHPDDRPFKSEE